jgi:formylglycine-generating enzyme required for sulfatase activity/energy-coupling factor transporter ATP-binding protein EcfA2
VGREFTKEALVKPGAEPVADKVRDWINRPDHTARDDAALQQAVQKALETGDFGLVELKLAEIAAPGRPELRQQVAAAVLSMENDQADQVSQAVVQALHLPASSRPVLARFLWALRQQLAGHKDFGPLIEFADRADERQWLRRTAEGVERLVGVLVPTPEALEKRYLSFLVESDCRYLPLRGRDPRESTQAGLPLRLERVYIALNTTERPAALQKAARLEAVGREEQKPISALRLALDNRCLLLLGEPGSGKSTFAEHLALCLAGERWQPGNGWLQRLATHDAAWSGRAPLPVRLRLREFAADTACLPTDEHLTGQAEHLLAYLEKTLRAGNFGPDFPAHVLRLLDSGDVMLVLDGLDEVSDPGRRQRVAEAIADFSHRRCSRVRIIVTCRVRQYPLDQAGRPAAPWALPRLRLATLADFDAGQIDDFVETWFGELCDQQRLTPEQRAEKTASLKVAIRARPDLRALAPRPILLTQMAIVHDVRGQLPPTRLQLYVECTELLLWEWERLRAERAGRRESADEFIQRLQAPGLQRDHLQSALDHAVYDAHALPGQMADAPADISEDTLRQYLTACIERTGLPHHEAMGRAQRFIDEYLRLRNGLIVPSGEGTFQTPHRSFQEFLAARHLAVNRIRSFTSEAPALVRQNYDLWREVFLLAVGQAGLNNAVDAIDRLCPTALPQTPDGWRYLCLAGRALAELSLPKVRSDEEGPELEKRVKVLLRRTMQDVDEHDVPHAPPRVPVRTRAEAGEVLDELGWLPPDLHAWVHVPGGPIYLHHTKRTVTVPTFWLARYPVTNAQYECFIQAGGYEEPRWWSKEGLKWLKNPPSYRSYRDDKVKQPKYWDNPRFNRKGYPVAGVSWYEAEAYCNWLTEQLQEAGCKIQVIGAGGEIGNLPLASEAPSRLASRHGGRDGASSCIVRLPTEEELLLAAGGEGKGKDEDRFPWDLPGQSTWQLPEKEREACIQARANILESRIGGTTPVGMYPAGASPCGVWDMAGNVWEWTGSWYDEKAKEVRVLRGGSWDAYQSLARCARRVRYDPDASVSGFGFRVVVSPGSPRIDT